MGRATEPERGARLAPVALQAQCIEGDSEIAPLASYTLLHLLTAFLWALRLVPSAWNASVVDAKALRLAEIVPDGRNRLSGKPGRMSRRLRHRDAGRYGG